MLIARLFFTTRATDFSFPPCLPLTYPSPLFPSKCSSLLPPTLRFVSTPLVLVLPLAAWRYHSTTILQCECFCLLSCGPETFTESPHLPLCVRPVKTYLLAFRSSASMTTCPTCFYTVLLPVCLGQLPPLTHLCSVPIRPTESAGLPVTL